MATWLAKIFRSLCVQINLNIVLCVPLLYSTLNVQYRYCTIPLLYNTFTVQYRYYTVPAGQKYVYSCEYAKHRINSYIIIIYLFIYYFIIYLYYLSSYLYYYYYYSSNFNNHNLHVFSHTNNCKPTFPILTTVNLLLPTPVYSNSAGIVNI